MYALIWMVCMSIAEAGVTLHDATWSVVNDTVMGGVSDADLYRQMAMPWCFRETSPSTTTADSHRLE